MRLRIATCQFPTSRDIGRNLEYVLRQMRIAHARVADVAHFPEACLSGYAGADIASTEEIDWDLLRHSTRRARDLAGDLGMWVVLGSTHRLTPPHKPHNSLYIISDHGVLVDRYDKLFCAGDGSPDPPTGDLANYSPGDHFSVFTIKGVRCGALICHDYRYPELYREYKRRGVDAVFHSFHAGHIDPDRMRLMREYVGAQRRSASRGDTIPAITQRAAMQAAAAANHMWISCPNSSARESCWGSFFVRPDGVVSGRLRRNVAGVLVSEIDTDETLYDSTAAWRDRAMDGVFHSGTPVQDPRSANRTQY